MIRHSPLSPFHLSAASAISNLKYIATTPSDGPASANKRRKLNVEAAPDSDLKAAANALKTLASAVFGDVDGSTTRREIQRSPLKPKDINAEANRSNFATTTTNFGESTKTTSKSFTLGRKPPSQPNQSYRVGYSTHHAKAGNEIHQPMHNHHHRSFYYGSSHHHHMQLPPRPVQRDTTSTGSATIKTHLQQPHPTHHRMHSHPPMMPNPMGWMWPMVPSQQPHHHSWPVTYANGGATHRVAPQPNRVPSAVVKHYSDAQRKGETTFPMAGTRGQHASAVNDCDDQEDWTPEDERRLATLVQDYQSMSRGAKRKHLQMMTRVLSDDHGHLEEEEEPRMESHHSDSCKNDDDSSLKGGRRKRTTWTIDEDSKLTKIVEDLKLTTDKICWSSVMHQMPGRDSKQCRDRWLNHLDSTAQNTKNAWTEEEDRKLVLFIKKHGTRWRLMQSTILPDRTELTIKNRWNSAMKRRYTRFLSKRWNVAESNIQLLTERGLLNPGVNVEQMLRVARCKMIEAAYSVGDAESSRDIVVAGRATNNSETYVEGDGNVNAEIGSLLENCEKEHQDGSTVQVRLLKGEMADDSVVEDLGTVAVPKNSSFALVRAMLTEKFKSLATTDFRFSVDKLGIITLRQEVDLGPMGALLQALRAGNGTEAEPCNLLVVS